MSKMFVLLLDLTRRFLNCNCSFLDLNFAYQQSKTAFVRRNNSPLPTIRSVKSTQVLISVYFCPIAFVCCIDGSIVKQEPIHFENWMHFRSLPILTGGSSFEYILSTLSTSERESFALILNTN